MDKQTYLNRIIQEKNGSLTINCNEGEITMSTRYFGMGKTYKTTQEAFGDPDWYVAIERPKSSECGLFCGLLVALFLSGLFGYIFWQAINRF